jgi:hypothetical protein
VAFAPAFALVVPAFAAPVVVDAAAPAFAVPAFVAPDFVAVVDFAAALAAGAGDVGAGVCATRTMARIAGRRINEARIFPG